MVFTGGTLYFDGIAVPAEIGEFTVDEVEPMEPVVRLLPYEEVTLSGNMKVDPYVLLKILLGRRITNNWLKMHGGVMRRGRWRK